MIWLTGQSGSEVAALVTDEQNIEDLDPHRTVTYLENGVPRCYMGHAECYDEHTTERLSDEADYMEDLARD